MLNELLIDEGGISIAPHPPTAFLTYKVVHALNQWDGLSNEARQRVKDWTWKHLYEESILIAAGSPGSQVFELGYATLTASQTALLDRMTPHERRVLQHAVDQFFAGQGKDGSWPRSRPLFLYPDLGYAYCYDYEMLVPLLADPQLSGFVSPHLDALRRAAWALDERKVPLVRTDLPAKGQKRAYGWSSEHHGREFQAESWPTASVFHFCFELQRVIAGAVRRDLFEYVGATYEEPRTEVPEGEPLKKLMESDVEYEPGKCEPFKDLFMKNFLQPLIDERDAVREGRAFGKKTKVSAILYGPPGTSKTRLARMISEALGWPLLSLDPSHFTRRGLDNIHSEADALFGRLQRCDQVLVLLDEIDELVREREASGEATSRFLTTAMLPKLADLHGRRKLVYLVATNHLEQFDAAISRPGRFDVIVPVMPPTAEAKLAHEDFKALADARTLLSNVNGGMPLHTYDEIVGDLTYDEAEELSEKLAGDGHADVIGEHVRRAETGATLNKAVVEPEGDAADGDANDGDPKDGDPKDDTLGDAATVASAGAETWKARIQRQQRKIRGLGL